MPKRTNQQQLNQRATDTKHHKIIIKREHKILIAETKNINHFIKPKGNNEMPKLKTLGQEPCHSELHQVTWM